MIHYSASLNALVLEGDADTWVFEPSADLTPAQLALALVPLLTGRAELVQALHPLIQRHFRRQDRVPRDAPQMNESEVLGELARLALSSPGEKLEELAAAGKRLSPEWTIIGTPWLVAGEAEFGCCVRLRNREQG